MAIGILASPVPTAQAAGWCPNNGQMQQMLGFDQRDVHPVNVAVPWDGCHWLWTAYGVGHLEFWLPDSWQATVTRNSDNVVAVYYGPAWLDAKGFTLRYRPGANDWVNNPCELLRREIRYGQHQGPSYGTANGNIPCY